MIPIKNYDKYVSEGAIKILLKLLILCQFQIFIKPNGLEVSKCYTFTAFIRSQPNFVIEDIGYRGLIQTVTFFGNQHLEILTWESMGKS